MGTGIVIVSGLPAAGKTTLSRRLSRDLGIPHVCRDELRHGFAEIAPVLPPDQPWLIGKAMDEMINLILGSLVDAGVGAVVDSNFNWAEQRDALRRFLTETATPVPCFEVCLWGDVDVLRRRFVERNNPPITPDLEPIVVKAYGRAREPVLKSMVPTVELDTTDFEGLEERYADLVDCIRQTFTLG